MTLRRAGIGTVATLALAAGLAGHAAPARAGALSVMPVRVEVPVGRRFCSLTLGNDSDRPVTVQVRGFGWSRDDTGADILTPDTGFAVNPAIATIPARASRLVRCSLPVDAASPVAERQWRLLVDELPDPAYAVPGEVQTLLRLSIPVFRAPDAAAPRLVAIPVAGGVRLANAGTRHVKVLAITLKGEGAAPVTVERAFYLLAGGSQVVPVAAMPRALASLQVRAEEGVLPVTLGPMTQ